jgi:predicted dehydrogenase
MSVIRVGLIGYGYWGPNLLRNLRGNPSFKIVAIAEGRADKREQAGRVAPGATLYDRGEDLINAADVDAVVIATPIAYHYPLAKQALSLGKHVLCEKPLCTEIAEAEDLIETAAARNAVLMIDHTFLFTGAVQSIAQLCRSGELGKISYYDSIRINLGLFQPDVNVMWDLAPHDLAIIDYLIDEDPLHVEAHGYCHVNAGIPDIVYMTLYYPSNFIAHLNLSWMSPVKVRRTAVGGLKKMLVWNDLDKEEKIKIYNSGIAVQPEAVREVIIPSYRIGDVYSPRIPETEALAGVIGHFGAVIRGEANSIMDGEKGLRVVRSMVKAQQSMDETFARLGASV